MDTLEIRDLDYKEEEVQQVLEELLKPRSRKS